MTVDAEPGMYTVFEVLGPHGSLDGVELAFQAKLEKLAQDGLVKLVKAEVLTDGGTYHNIIYGELSRITGYRIRVSYDRQFQKEGA